MSASTACTPLRRRLMNSHAVSKCIPLLLTAGFLFTLPTLVAHAQAPLDVPLGPCGKLSNAFGPFDYRIERGHNLYLVEMAHFTVPVESLIKGNAGYLGSDLDYTLRAFPNHHRALIAVMRYGEKAKLPHLPHMNYSVECYFARALNFRPDDTVARIIYAQYLDRNQRPEEAIAELKRAADDAGDSALTHYNVGLAHMSARRFELARQAAHKAASLGFTRSDLRQGLIDAGQWREPERAGASSASASGAAPSR